MLTPEQVKTLLAARKPGHVKKLTGLSYPSIKAAASGRPISLSTLLKLSAYFEGSINEPQ